MLEQKITIINKLGLHARAAAKLVNTASRFESRVSIAFGSHHGDAKSIMSVMMLAASQGSEVVLTTEGPDEKAAIEAISDLINNYFEEEE